MYAACHDLFGSLIQYSWMNSYGISVYLHQCFVNVKALNDKVIIDRYRNKTQKYVNRLHTTYMSDVKWAWLLFQPPTPPFFVQQLVLADNNKNLKLPATGSLWGICTVTSISRKRITNTEIVFMSRNLHVCEDVCTCLGLHDDVIKWKHFPRNWPFVRGIHQSTVNSPDKGQWRGALMFLWCFLWSAPE